MRPRFEFFVIVVLSTTLFLAAVFEVWPIGPMMDWKAATNAAASRAVNVSTYQEYNYSINATPLISIDFRQGRHFWNPQMAIWLEDSAGTYLETLFITTSTAKGLFYSGRSAANFMQFDGVKSNENESTRRVDALPYWSHKRGHRYPDGFYSPPPSDPLPDGITGATPKNNFYLKTDTRKLDDLETFHVRVEVNVAFDENEYYSEYDFVDDSLYHGGTGLLGQPSLVYGVTVNRYDTQTHYIMSLLGHGHHSGQTGELFSELESVTTARHVLDRIVVSIHESWYRPGRPR